MSYLVMECHPSYAVLLDEEGRFLKAANLRYEIGQTVYDPVLMKETPERQRHTMRWISSGIAAIAACFLLFFGISSVSYTHLLYFIQYNTCYKDFLRDFIKLYFNICIICAIDRAGNPTP